MDSKGGAGDRVPAGNREWDLPDGEARGTRTCTFGCPSPVLHSPQVPYLLPTATTLQQPGDVGMDITECRTHDSIAWPRGGLAEDK